MQTTSAESKTVPGFDVAPEDSQTEPGTVQPNLEMET